MTEDERMAAFLQAEIDRGTMSIRRFIEKNGVGEMAGLMAKLCGMSKSEDSHETMLGILAGFGLAVALRDYYHTRDKAEG